MLQNEIQIEGACAKVNWSGANDKFGFGYARKPNCYIIVDLQSFGSETFFV